MILFFSAFIFVDPATSDRVVFVNADIAFTTENINTQVIERLAERYGSMYKISNVAITATHTHSGVAGYAQYVMFQVTSKGWSQQCFDAIVDGIVESIVLAHESVRPAYLTIATGELEDANVNRSPSSYENNPAEERALYSHNTDRTMTLLKIKGTDGEDIGMLNWFGTSLVSLYWTVAIVCYGSLHLDGLA